MEVVFRGSLSCGSCISWLTRLPASGKRLYVQLKSGDSYLKKRQRDGAERFLTCDDRLIRRYSGQMIVQSPVTFTTNLM